MTQTELEYACSNEVQEICAQAGSQKLGTTILKLVDALLKARADVVQACEIADRYIFAPDVSLDGSAAPIVLDTAIVTIDSSGVYRDKSRITGLLETYKK